MSSDQVSENALPPEKKRCPHCGEVMASSAEMCWLCREKFSVRAGPAPLNAGGASPGQPGDNPAWIFFGCLAILLCGALAFEAPGVLVVLLILATPALIRTVVVAAGKHQASPENGFTMLGTFLSSLGVATLVGLASFVAFFATCFVVCLGGLSISNGNNASGGDWVLPVSVIAGLVPGIAVVVSLFRYFWLKKG